LWFHSDSQQQTGCQRAMPQTPRDRWATRARPVEEVKKKLQAVIETTLPRTQRSILGAETGFWGGPRIAATEGQPNVT
jgi:hypothetical protein